MKIDILIYPSGDMSSAKAWIQGAEACAYDGAWAVENAHNPFFPLTIAASDTRRIQLGTVAASAFPRSPMVTAQIAWDLARQSGGRFVLGLSAEDRTIDRMREYIESLRAIWATFQHDDRLRFRGRYYQFRLMAPFFNPGPIPHPDIPIFLYGDGPQSWSLAGEVCQGLHASFPHSRAQLRNTVIPAIKDGLARGGRSREDFEIAVPVFIVTGRTQEEMQRRQGEVMERIASLTRSGRAHSGEVADVELDELTIAGEPGEIAAIIMRRYGDIADRVCLMWENDDADLLTGIPRELRSLTI